MSALVRLAACCTILLASASALGACPSSTHETGLANFALSPDGKRIAAIARDGTVLSWDVQTGLRTILMECIQPVPIEPPIVFSSDSTRVAVADRGAIEILELPSGRRLRRFEEDGVSVEYLVFSGDSRRMAALSYLENAENVIAWDLETGKKLLVLPARPVRFALALSTNGELMLLQSRDGVDIWDIARKKLVRTIALHSKEEAEGLAFAHDDEWVVGSTAIVLPIRPGDRFVQYDRSIAVWEIATGRKVKILAGSADELSFPLVVTSSGTIVTSSYENTLRIWDLEAGRLKEQWNSRPGTPSANGQYLLRVSGYPGRLDLWKIGAPEAPRIFEYKSPLCQAIDWESPAEAAKARFEITWMGNGETGDRATIGFTGFVAQDCTPVTRSHYYFESQERAKEELHRKMQRATKLVEQGWPKAIWAYGLLGDRAVLLFSESPSGPGSYSLVWSSGKDFFKLDSPSLQILLEIERQSLTQRTTR